MYGQIAQLVAARQAKVSERGILATEPDGRPLEPEIGEPAFRGVLNRALVRGGKAQSKGLQLGRAKDALGRFPFIFRK